MGSSRLLFALVTAAGCSLWTLSAFAEDTANAKKKALLEQGNALTKKAEKLAHLASRATADVEKAKLVAESRAAVQASRKVFEAATKAFRAEVDAYPKFVPNDQVEIRAKRDRARQNLIQARLGVGHCLFSEGRLHRAGVKQHQQLLTQAADHFRKLGQDYRTRLAGLYAFFWEGRCHHELGDLRQALSKYMELLDQPDAGQQVLIDFKTKVLRWAITAWNDARQQKYDESIKRGDAWLLRAGPDKDKKPDGLAILYLLAQAKHLRIQEDLAAVKNDPAKQVDQQLHNRLKLDIPILARIVADRPGEYQKAAKELLGRYQDFAVEP